jgi:AraC-like DNA-binding protein
MRGGLHQQRIVLATILDSASRVTQWWKDVRPGDIGVFPPLAEFDAIHGGGAAYLAVSIALPELLAMIGGEEHLADPAFWNTNRVYNTDSTIGANMLQRLIGIISGIEHKLTAPAEHVADFLQRSIVESFVLALMSALPAASTRSYTGARLVTETENYTDAAGGRPVHISELCNALKVSRRSLHRSFTDTLGIGPAAYLRRKRLSAILYAESLYSIDDVPGASPHVSANENRGGARLDHDFASSRFFVFANTDFMTDALQDLNLRSVVGGGIGYHLIDRDNATLNPLGWLGPRDEMDRASHRFGKCSECYET